MNIFTTLMNIIGTVDIIFILFFSLVLTVIVVQSFNITDFTEYIKVFFGLLAIVFVIYSLLKNNNPFDHDKVQNKMIFIVLLIIVFIILLTLLVNIIANRNTTGGFINFIVMIFVFLLLAIFITANFRLNDRYFINDPYSIFKKKMGYRQLVTTTSIDIRDAENTRNLNLFYTDPRKLNNQIKEKQKAFQTQATGAMASGRNRIGSIKNKMSSTFSRYNPF